MTFNNHKSYMKAVCAGFIELKTPKFTKKVRKCFLSVGNKVSFTFIKEVANPYVREKTLLSEMSFL